MQMMQTFLNDDQQSITSLRNVCIESFVSLFCCSSFSRLFFFLAINFHDGDENLTVEI